MKNYFLLIILLLSFHISHSQTIKGIVLDAKTEQPIENVHVYFNSNNNGTITNSKGKFKLKLPIKKQKNNVIHFSHIGYKNQELVYYKNEKEYSVYLIAKNLELEEVELLAKKKLKSRLNYNKLAPMKSKLHSFGSLLIGNKIYVFGGDKSYETAPLKEIADEFPDASLDESLGRANRLRPPYNSYSNLVLSYDLISNHWKIEDLKLRKRAYHNIVYNKSEDKIYILGGVRLSRNKRFEYLDDKIEVLTVGNKTVEIDKTNPHKAANAASFVYKGNIIVMGGATKKKQDGESVFSNKIHVYDTKSGFWYELNNMPMAKELNGILVNDKIYVFGGNNGKALSGIETYDLVSGKWKKEGELFSGLNRPAITQNNEIIYLFENGKVVCYNTKTKELKKYTIGLHLNAAKMFIFKNKLYILGGYTQNEFSKIPSQELYTVNLNEFNTTKVTNYKKIALEERIN